MSNPSLRHSFELHLGLLMNTTTNSSTEEKRIFLAFRIDFRENSSWVDFFQTPDLCRDQSLSNTLPVPHKNHGKPFSSPLTESSRIPVWLSIYVRLDIVFVIVFLYRSLKSSISLESFFVLPTDSSFSHFVHLVSKSVPCSGIAAIFSDFFFSSGKRSSSLMDRKRGILPVERGRPRFPEAETDDTKVTLHSAQKRKRRHRKRKHLLYS